MEAYQNNEKLFKVYRENVRKQLLLSELKKIKNFGDLFQSANCPTAFRQYHREEIEKKK